MFVPVVARLSVAIYNFSGNLFANKGTIAYTFTYCGIRREKELSQSCPMILL